MTTTETIHLQGIGKVRAIPASEAKAGMMMTYNYGSQAEIIAVKDVSPKFVAITTMSLGLPYTRRYGKDRLIAAHSRTEG